jgi:hypothetical protein
MVYVQGVCQHHTRMKTMGVLFSQLFEFMIVYFYLNLQEPKGKSRKHRGEWYFLYQWRACTVLFVPYHDRAGSPQLKGSEKYKRGRLLTTPCRSLSDSIHRDAILANFFAQGFAMNSKLLGGTVSVALMLFERL